jgi:hypothetical protein
MRGGFGEKRVAGDALKLMLTSGGGVLELMKKRVNSAMTGMTIKSTIAMAPSRVKRR